MTKIIDRKGYKVVDGSIIDIHQTVNGQNLFVVLKTNPLDVRYFDDLDHKYEYDKEDLLKISQPYTDEVDFEIIGNLSDDLDIHMFVGLNKIFNLKHFEFNGETNYEFRGIMNDKVVESDHAQYFSFSFPCVKIAHERVVTVQDFLNKINK